MNLPVSDGFTLREMPDAKKRSATKAQTEIVSQYFGDPRNYLDIRRYVIEIRKETVQEFIVGRRFRRILDVGCGDGSISIPLLGPQNHLTLLDISRKMLSRALSNVPQTLSSHVEVINQDLIDAQLGANSFDLILCIGVLAHVNSPHAVISKLSSLLCPGGFLVLECTDASHFSNQLTVLCARTRRVFSKPRCCPPNLMSADSVLEMTKQAGLKVVSSYRHNLALPTMRRFLSQKSLQAITRAIFGTASRNRNAWLGKECLFLFTRYPK